MKKSFEGNLLIAHGGGPTAVINASLQGVVEEAKKYIQIKGIYGARYGVEGLLQENFIDLGMEHAEKIRMLSQEKVSLKSFHRTSMGAHGQSADQYDPRVYITPIMDILITGKETADSDILDIIECIKRGVKEVVGTLIVQFGSVGYALRIEQVPLEEMVDRYKRG